MNWQVQLTAPGVNSSGAVWVGFPVLRQCFNDVLGWTQTTNNPCMSDLFGYYLAMMAKSHALLALRLPALLPDSFIRLLHRLEMAGEDAYVIDGTVKKLEKHVETIRVLHSDGTHTEELLEIRRSVHGPVVMPLFCSKLSSLQSASTSGILQPSPHCLCAAGVCPTNAGGQSQRAACRNEGVINRSTWSIRTVLAHGAEPESGGVGGSHGDAAIAYLQYLLCRS